MARALPLSFDADFGLSGELFKTLEGSSLKTCALSAKSNVI